MHKKILVVGNWKMYLSIGESCTLADQIGEYLQSNKSQIIAVAVCPSMIALPRVVDVRNARGAGVFALGAQDMHWEARGAFTGGTSPEDIMSLGCEYVLVGHSERREWFGETDERVARTVCAAQSVGLLPIVCVGETAQEREAGLTDTIVGRQVQSVRAAAVAEREIIFAYEPRWAIGTGVTVEPKEANRVAAHIKELWGFPDRCKVLYGGSVTAGNCAGFCAESMIDGILPGGASTTLQSMRSMLQELT